MKDKEAKYMQIYRELIDRINEKEYIIEKMTGYIVKHAHKVNSMCKRTKYIECSEKQCRKCVRNYFEKRYNQ